MTVSSGEEIPARPGRAERTAACLLVCFAHVNIATRGGVGGWVPGGIWGVPLFSLAVPAFFLISGWHLGGGGERRRGGREFRRLVPPFLCWNAVMLLLGAAETPGGPFVVLLTGAWHLYFIFALLQCLLAHRALVAVRGSAGENGTLAFAAALGAVAYGLSSWVLWRHGGDSGQWESVARKAFAPWAVFFFFGVWLADRPAARRRIFGNMGLLVAAAVPLYAVYIGELWQTREVYGHNPRLQFVGAGLPFQIVGGLLLIGGVRAMADVPVLRRAHRILARTAARTYAIYLAHCAALVVWLRMLGEAGLRTVHWAEVPCLVALVWMTCLALRRAADAFAPPRLARLVFGTSQAVPARRVTARTSARSFAGPPGRGP